MKFLTGYPDSLQSQVQQLQTQGKLGDMLLKKYPRAYRANRQGAL